MLARDDDNVGSAGVGGSLSSLHVCVVGDMWTGCAVAERAGPVVLNRAPLPCQLSSTVKGTGVLRVSLPGPTRVLLGPGMTQQQSANSVPVVVLAVASTRCCGSVVVL